MIRLYSCCLGLILKRGRKKVRASIWNKSLCLTATLVKVIQRKCMTSTSNVLFFCLMMSNLPCTAGLPSFSPLQLLFCWTQIQSLSAGYFFISLFHIEWFHLSYWSIFSCLHQRKSHCCILVYVIIKIP